MLRTYDISGTVSKSVVSGHGMTSWPGGHPTCRVHRSLAVFGDRFVSALVELVSSVRRVRDLR